MYRGDPAQSPLVNNKGVHRTCCGPIPYQDVAKVRIFVAASFAIGGLLIWVALSTSAMGYGLISSAPQLERTTGYTHDMKISTEGAINGAQDYYQRRMARFPPNQVDVWFKQFSSSLESIDHILASIKAQIGNALGDMENMLSVAVTAGIKAFVPVESKATIVKTIDDAAAIVSKYRAAVDLLTPEEIAATFRSGSKLIEDSDVILSAISKVMRTE